MLAQLGVRKTEDMKAPGSIPCRGRFVWLVVYISAVQRGNDSAPIIWASCSNRDDSTNDSSSWGKYLYQGANLIKKTNPYSKFFAIW